MLTLLLACSTPSPHAPEQADEADVTASLTPLDPADAAARYQLSFADAARHRVVVHASARCPEDGEQQWWMPVWTPGSYLVREFARRVETLRSEPPGATKIAKNRWSVPCTAGEHTAVEYTLYARDLSVRESFVDAEFGVLNGASTFLLPEGDPGRPLDVALDLPPGWTSHTALTPHPAGDADRYLARDVDTLVDSPMLLGTPHVHSFEIAGVPHHLVTLGEDRPWDHAKAAADVETITRAQVAFWGEIPYPAYWYLNVLAEQRGGLEHLDSTLMMTSRWNLVKREDRLHWLSLVSHEFFHTWNVKRLRPRGLGPFDYESEVHTESLWIAEGITSYYDDLLLARSGLMTEAEYVAQLGKSVKRLQATPGHLVQPLADASYDTWIKFYRKDENTPNSTISYYTKGAVVGWLLDAEIRRATQGRASLDDVMRTAWTQHREEGFTPKDFRTVATQVAGQDLSGFFERAVDRADPLDYGGALQWFGLRFKPAGEATSDGRTPGWLGAGTADRGGRIVVTQVLRDTPAWEAGVNVDDEVLAFDDVRLMAGNLSVRLEQLGAGAEGILLVNRRGRLVTLPLTLGARPAMAYELEMDPGASPLASRRRTQWLSP